jgi:glucose-1-phosphate thymidylyltransferase
VKDHARALLEAASFVDAAQLRALAEPLRKNGYGHYLLQILQEPLL